MISATIMFFITLFFISFLSASGIMHFLYCVKIFQNKENDFNRKFVIEREILYQQRMEKDQEIMDNKEELFSVVNKIIKNYEKCFHPIPCRIIENVYKNVDWILDNLSKKEGDQKIEFLLQTIVFNRIDKAIEKDTEDYNTKIRKKDGNNDK